MHAFESAYIVIPIFAIMTAKLCRFSWGNVVRRFDHEYQLTFSKGKKVNMYVCFIDSSIQSGPLYLFQAHFDCLPLGLNIVDGAKMKWSAPLMLDAMVFLLSSGCYKSSARRSFDQQKTLVYCIVKELRNEFMTVNHEGSYFDDSSSDINHFLTFEANQVIEQVIGPLNGSILYSIQVEDLPDVWISFASLKSFLAQDPPPKAKSKFQQNVNLLCDQLAILQDGESTEQIIRRLIFIVLSEVTRSASSHKALHTRVKSLPPIASLAQSNNVASLQVAAPLYSDSSSDETLLFGNSYFISKSKKSKAKARKFTETAEDQPTHSNRKKPKVGEDHHQHHHFDDEKCMEETKHILDSNYISMDYNLPLQQYDYPAESTIPSDTLNSNTNQGYVWTDDLSLKSILSLFEDEDSMSFGMTTSS